jgi:carbon monoxide dehydrogenase subunit G
MASLTISRRFEVPATPERVWSYLVTPELVANCLPGAALLSSSPDGRSHEGTVTVKLGALGVSYSGTADFEEIDDAARQLRVRAKGREKTGAGTAEMTMTARVASAEAGGSEVSLDASASVSGKIVTLGRGMIEVVSEQVLSDFAECLSARLVEGGRGSGGSPAEGDEGPATTATPANALSILWRSLRSWLRRVLGGS